MNRWIDIHWLMTKWFIEITHVSLNKQVLRHDERFMAWIIFPSKILLFEIIYTINVLEKVSLVSTLKGFSKSIRQSISWNKVDSDWISPLLLSSCHLIIDPLRISHVTYHELERCSLKKDFHRHCELLISLGCSGITTRIMRRTLKILLVFTVCKQQVNKYLVS